jgi:hypothetical protein
METSKLKKFASFARSTLIEQVGTRLKTVLADQSLARRESAAAVTELEKKIKELGKERVIEMVAYTWFNRFCALRFMDVNQYTTIGTVSPAEGFTQPEILTEAKQGVIDEELRVDRQRIFGLLDGTRPSQDAQGEVYQQLLIAVCNSYHKLMPFMFEKIADYTELLIPEDLLSDSSVLAETRKALTTENCADVEVIGWLYQFYISEKKDDVFAALKKGKKITPENIPAATQLFTPHWIVRYLVENSLGRLWMLNHSDSRLIEQMEYYIKPEESETDYLKISSPEEIKICDPACGSGHMLTYAFDLLYPIYEEQGYQATDIPRLILKHNLYGVEIDHRAGALAAFALVMKARQKDRRFFSRKPLNEDSSTAIQNPNICVLENIQIDPDDLSAYMDKVGRDLFSGGLQGVVNQWEEADNFGSLIRPLVTDVSEMLELLRDRQMGEDLFLDNTHQKVLKALKQADYLSPKYHVVVANPPYMGSKGMGETLKKYVEKNYAEAKHDAFSAFMLRSVELAASQIGMVTPFVWMFISSFEELRGCLFESGGISSLVHLEYNAFEPACVPVCAFTIDRSLSNQSKGTYIRLSDFRGHENQAPKTLEAITNEECSYKFQTSQSSFTRIPGKPLAYWVGDTVISLFADNEPLEKIADSVQGIITGDNPKYLRYWFEPSRCSLAIGYETMESIDLSKEYWIPYNKGGDLRKWYGNNDWVIDWSSEGEGLHRSRTQNRQLYLLPGITWTRLSSSFFGVRHFGAGFLWDVAGSGIFPKKPADHLPLLGLLCSPYGKYILDLLNPTLAYQVENILAIPIGDRLAQVDSAARSRIEELVGISKFDWDQSETSWDFSRNPICGHRSSTLQAAFAIHESACHARISGLRELEHENNQTFLKLFGLTEILDPTVPEDQITLNHFENEEDGKNFISYAVGCMLGRYSLDKPGLILANQGDTLEDYLRILAEHQGANGDNLNSKIENPKFLPDEDNVIPLLDGDWFEDDITERFKTFLKVTFGTEHYEENLTFLENSLYPDNATGKKRKTIRDYFLKDFYSHHIKLYKKRPIYWLFSSPKGTFNALIYMHRYRPDTVGTVLHYLRDFRDKLTHHADHQQMLADSASASKSEKTQAIKDVAAIKKQLKELEDYEKTLFEVAARKIDIDLDDGVKYNYLLFGSVLRKIPGLDAKED